MLVEPHNWSGRCDEEKNFAFVGIELRPPSFYLSHFELIINRERSEDRMPESWIKSIIWFGSRETQVNQLNVWICFPCCYFILCTLRKDRLKYCVLFSLRFCSTICGFCPLIRSIVGTSDNFQRFTSASISHQYRLYAGCRPRRLYKFWLRFLGMLQLVIVLRILYHEHLIYLLPSVSSFYRFLSFRLCFTLWNRSAGWFRTQGAWSVPG